MSVGAGPDRQPYEPATRAAARADSRSARIGRNDALVLGALFAGSLALFALQWHDGLKGSGVSTIGAERVLHGDLPYRDFWTIYAPGQFYLLALLFRVFGTHLLVEVAAASIVCAAAACACYLFVSRWLGRRPEAVACALLFIAAVNTTSYYRSLGSYAPAILLIFVVLNLLATEVGVLGFGQVGVLGSGTGGGAADSGAGRPGLSRRILATAGALNGVLVVIKHDVGGYTAIAVVAGLATLALLGRREAKAGIALYAAGLVLVALPVFVVFGFLAGRDMLQNLIVFPLTDFPYSRPQGYPSLLPVGLAGETQAETLLRVVRYLTFTVPFVLFLLGVLATLRALRAREPATAAWGVTFAVAFLLHHRAAHVQINTHVITLTVYGAFLGLLFLDWKARPLGARPPAAVGGGQARGSLRTRAIVLAVTAGWLLALAAGPAYTAWARRDLPSAALELPKGSGFEVPPGEAHDLANVAAFVDEKVPPGQPIFVGLHRHDVVIQGDAMLYFLLDRPSATRYQELHPAIVDTRPVQLEMIRDLERHRVPLVVLKHSFDDATLEQVKRSFKRDLPRIGATDLDEFLRATYERVQTYGRYEVWVRR